MKRQLTMVLAVCLMTAARASAETVRVVAGPMIGNVTARSARIWMQFSLAGTVTIAWYDISQARPVSQLKLDVEGRYPFTLDAPINQLQPDSSYRIEVKFDDDPVRLPGPEVVIRTAPPPGSESAMSVAFGSNLGVMPMPAVPPGKSNPLAGFAPPAAPAEKPSLPIMRAIADLKPRAFLFLGNTGYLPPKLEDFPTLRTNATTFITAFHDRVRQMPDLQPLFRATACYAVFNDRDYGPAGADGSYVFATESQLAFERFWPNPDWGVPDHPGCFSTFTLGDADFFLLDTRTFRRSGNGNGAAGGGPGGAGDTLLGEPQLDWLKKSLKESKASFKILAAPCLLFGDDPAHPEKDSWSQFAAEQRAFLEWLAANHINGVMALAGGRPGGELLKVDAVVAVPGLKYPLFTLGTSALASLPGVEPLQAVTNPHRVGSLVTQNNFGTLDFSGTGEHRFVALRLRDGKGEIRTEQLVFAVQLHP